ncbi:MAG: hypothetical protein KAU38_10995, partial [Desulfobacterales bacterium]|nr:hypothetical protein [Desulfobacterales bacterium]
VSGDGRRVPALKLPPVPGDGRRVAGRCGAHIVGLRLVEARAYASERDRAPTLRCQFCGWPLLPVLEAA